MVWMVHLNYNENNSYMLNSWKSHAKKMNVMCTTDYAGFPSSSFH